MLRRRSLGLITTSNFFVPQVNLPGSMGTFVAPAGAQVAIAAAKRSTGMGRLGLPLIAPSMTNFPTSQIPTPGLPVGYNPVPGSPGGGQVDPSNVTGATVQPAPGSYGAAVNAWLQTQGVSPSAPVDCTGSFWDALLSSECKFSDYFSGGGGSGFLSSGFLSSPSTWLIFGALMVVGVFGDVLLGAVGGRHR